VIFLFSLFLSDIEIKGTNFLSERIACGEIPWRKGDSLPCGFDSIVKANLEGTGVFREIEVHADTFLDSVDLRIHLKGSGGLSPSFRISWSESAGLGIGAGLKLRPLLFLNGEIFFIYYMLADTGYEVGGRIKGTPCHPAGAGIAWVRHTYFNTWLERTVEERILHVEFSMYDGPGAVFERINDFYLWGIILKRENVGVKTAILKGGINTGIFGGYGWRKMGRWRVRIGGDVSLGDTLPYLLKFCLGNGEGIRSRELEPGDMRYYVNLEYELFSGEGWLKALGCFLDAGNTSPSFPHFSVGLFAKMDVWVLKSLKLGLFWDGEFGFTCGLDDAFSHFHLGTFHFDRDSP